ncbi:MAG: hypothetical protein ACJAWS_001491 [Oleiphilaceae bacterium]
MSWWESDGESKKVIPFVCVRNSLLKADIKFNTYNDKFVLKKLAAIASKFAKRKVSVARSRLTLLTNGITSYGYYLEPLNL